MRWLLSISLFAALLAPPKPSASSAPNCSPRGPVVGMTLGLRTVGHSKSTVSSAQAIAPIVEIGAHVPVAWILWDETGTPWIMLRASTPHSIRAMVGRLLHGGSVDDLEPLIYGVDKRTIDLPAGYKLTSCSDLSV